jgi:hypothetical protein
VRSVAALLSGIAGAGLGVAELFKRGTGTDANIFADYQGKISIANPVNLDANGGATVYVNEEVDVLVKGANGTSVREWTEMGSANNVEYIGHSFTGTSYDDGSKGTGQPTTLQQILDLWLGSAGEPDFNVLFGGVSTTIQGALAGFSGIFFNVKNPAYGAKGDGLTDDTTAITAAMAAASVVQGMVFFPPGTYRVVSTLSVPANVSMACTAGATLTIDHATQELLKFDIDTTGAPQLVYGFTLTASQSNSGDVVFVTSQAQVILVNCVIGSANAHGFGLHMDASGTSTVWASKCTFNSTGALQAISQADSTGKRLFVDGCFFSQSITGIASSFINANNAVITNSDFVTASGSLGQFVGFGSVSNSNCSMSITGCRFENQGGGTPIGFFLTVRSDTEGFAESGNTFVNVSVLYGFSVVSLPTTRIPFQLGSRIGNMFNVTDDSAATPEYDGISHDVVCIKRTTNGNQTFKVGIPPWEGLRLLVILWNKSGGASGTLTYGNKFRSSGNTINIASDDTYATILLVSKANNSGTLQWALTAAVDNGV